MPSLGGTPVHVITDVDSAVTFSPDAKRIAWIRISSKTNSSAVYLSDADGANEQAISTLRFPELYNPVGPGWSEDGNLLAVARSAPRGVGNGSVINVINLNTKESKPLGTREFSNMQRLVWLPDDAGLIFTSPANSMTFNSQIWEVTYPDGEPRRVTNDLNYYSGASVTSDGGTLATGVVDYFESVGRRRRWRHLVFGPETDHFRHRPCRWGIRCDLAAPRPDSVLHV